MFTGIIETVGTVVNISPRGNYKLLRIKPDKPFNNIMPGESISVDGCCLTVTEFDKSSFTVEASQETLGLAITGTYKSGRVVNLERALMPASRLGGHIVSGHVDCKGKIVQKKKIGQSILLTIEYPDEFDKYLVPKGSIAIDGISLTVNELSKNRFTVNLIPFTRKETAIELLKVGTHVNLEFDILGKYAVKLLEKGGGDFRQKSNLSINKLIESGW